MTDDSLMPYGMYIGTKLKDVPAKYLLDKLKNNQLTNDVKAWVLKNLNKLKSKL